MTAPVQLHPDRLAGHGFERFADLFEDNEIDGEVLFDLTDDDLKDLGLKLVEGKTGSASV